jgi:hypothetical protein
MNGKDDFGMDESLLKFLGVLGVAVSVLSFMLAIYLFLKSAVLISLTRDIAFNAIVTSDAGSMRQWIDTLASSWSHSLIPIPILAALLLLYSLLLLKAPKWKS